MHSKTSLHLVRYWPSMHLCNFHSFVTTSATQYSVHHSVQCSLQMQKGSMHLNSWEKMCTTP